MIWFGIRSPSSRDLFALSGRFSYQNMLQTIIAFLPPLVSAVLPSTRLPGNLSTNTLTPPAFRCLQTGRCALFMGANLSPSGARMFSFLASSCQLITEKGFWSHSRLETSADSAGGCCLITMFTAILIVFHKNAVDLYYMITEVNVWFCEAKRSNMSTADVVSQLLRCR